MELSFGNWLVLRRRQAHLTQAKIAEALRVKPQTVSAWERDKAEPALNPAQTERLCQLLGVTIEQLSQAFQGEVKISA